MTITDDVLNYTGPNSPRIEFFLCRETEDSTSRHPKSLPSSPPKIDGVELNLDLEYNYLSPFMVSKTGSNIVTLKYGDRSWEYDFEKNTVTEAPPRQNSAL